MHSRLHASSTVNALKKGQWWLLGLVVILGLSFVWLTTVGGKGRPIGRYAGAHDFIYFYAGGGCYRDGINPYTYDLYTQWATDHLANHPQVDPSTKGVGTGYAYPPTAALPFWAIAHLSFNPARLLWLGLNWASLAIVLGVMWLAMRGGARSDPGRSDVPHDIGRWAWAGPIILAGFALMNPFTSHNMWMGQSSLIALAILCGAWWAKEKDHWLLCAFLTALATAKISMSVFFVLTLLVERRWRTFFATCAFCFVLAAIPLWHDGPLGIAQTWLESMKRYREARPSLPESTESFGMRSLAAVWFGVQRRVGSCRPARVRPRRLGPQVVHIPGVLRRDPRPCGPLRQGQRLRPRSAHPGARRLPHRDVSFPRVDAVRRRLLRRDGLPQAHLPRKTRLPRHAACPRSRAAGGDGGSDPEGVGVAATFHESSRPSSERRVARRGST